MTNKNNVDIINCMEEEEIIMKKWFPAEPLLKEFLKTDEKEDKQAFIERLGIDRARLIQLQKPGTMIGATVADKYAIRLRVSPVHDMG